MQIFAKTRLTAMAMALAGAGFMVGCGTSVPNASPIIENPTSDVTGRVTDAVTGEPIDGAKVIVEGVNISATTDEQGYYILKDVPANAEGVDETGNANSYSVSIDMRKVSSPVKMSDSSITNRYADLDTTGNTLTVRSSNVSGTAEAIGETGVNNSKDFMVGKASSSIEGHVYDMDSTTAVAGMKVVLTNSAGDTIATMMSMADDEATADVDETGMFHFHDVEAGDTYTVDAFMTDGSMSGSFTTATVFEEKEVNIDELGRIVLAYSDTTGPSISNHSMSTAITHDVAADQALTLVYTFDEPIAANDYRDSTAAGGALNGDITVSYNGAKAGNVVHTLAWNADFTQLTVTVPTLSVTSKYSIAQAIGTSGDLVDALGNKSGVIGATTVNVVTNGASDLAAPTLANTDAGPFDASNGAMTFVFTQVDGAKSYNLYRQATVAGTAQDMELVANGAGPTLTESAPGYSAGAPEDLVTEEFEAVKYNYFVAAVNRDGDVGTMSTDVVLVEDKTIPTLGATSCTPGATYAAGSDITINFSEVIAKADATNAKLGIPAAASIDYNGNQVVAHYTTDICAVPTTSGNVTVQDVAGNAMAAGTTFSY
ncbi:MAG: carboxypeptidase-like regulatory domain-containing protein [Gammaproteobacteria bacterium]|nr:carboxypeptidase-like regulatory domain-containing protein [Gammaproteobacteria bacterium]